MNNEIDMGEMWWRMIEVLIQMLDETDCRYNLAATKDLLYNQDSLDLQW